MRGNTKIASCFFVFILLLSLVITPLSSLKIHAESTETNLVIDDFESYATDQELKSVYGLWSPGGNAIEWTLSQNYVNDGANSIHIIPNEPLDSWAALSHNFSVSDWTDYSGISFWIHNQAEEPFEFTFDLKSESKVFGQEGAFNALLKEDGNDSWEEISFDTMLTIPKNFSGIVRIAWDQFTQKAWQCIESCDNPNLAKMEGVEFGYNPQANPTNEIYIDSIGLWGTSDGSDEEPVEEPYEPREKPLPPDWATDSETFNLNYKRAPIDNPLKGFLPFSKAREEQYYEDNDETWRSNVNQMPYSMEFFYLPLKDIMTNFNEYDWSKLESRIDDIASRGNQAIFRVYLDYPHKPSGIPQFLIDLGLETKEYDYFNNGGPDGTSVAPDYDDENLNTAVLQFIGALGEKYDGDPRVGFIQAGLIGFWGEWHTYPQDGWTPTGSWDGELAEHEDGHATDWMPSLANQEAIIQTFDDSFDETRVLVRYPTAFNRDLNIGFHDDSFAFQTLPPSYGGMEWHFVGRLQSNNAMENWKEEPIGGEMRPEIQIDMWNNDPPQYLGEPIEGAQGEDFYDSLSLTHASWLKVQGIFQVPLEEDALERAREASRSLGYEYHVPTAYVNANNGHLQAAIEVKNTGVAPFYQNWKVELAARDEQGNIKEWTTDWDISGILPNDEETGDNNEVLLEWTSDTSILGSGTHDILVRVVNPLSEITSKAKAFHFANEEQETNGWLNIGQVQVEGSDQGDQDDDQEDQGGNEDDDQDSNPNATTVDDSVVNNVVDGGTLEITLDDSDNSMVNLSASQVATLKAKSAVIYIKKNDVELTIPAENFGEGSVEIVVTKQESNPDALSTVYDFTIIQAGKEIHSFKAPVTLKFKVEESRVQDPDKIKIYYFDEQASEWVSVGGTYKDGYVTTETNHFTQFAVFEKADQVVPDNGDTSEDGNELPDTAMNMFNSMLLGTILLLAGAITLFIRRKQVM